MISIQGAVYIVVYLVIAGIIFWLLNYLVDIAPASEPFKRVAKFILIALAVLVCIGFLLSLISGTPVFRP